jgi:hypothetical protein
MMAISIDACYETTVDFVLRMACAEPGGWHTFSIALLPRVLNRWMLCTDTGAVQMSFVAVKESPNTCNSLGRNRHNG